jgi:anti-anti-sigma factor
MQVNEERLASVPMLGIVGEIDYANAPGLFRRAEKIMDRGFVHVILDLEECGYIDSGGVRALLEIVRRLRHRGWLGVIAPNAQVRRLLQFVGLAIDPGFRVFDTREEASEALGAAA